MEKDKSKTEIIEGNGKYVFKVRGTPKKRPCDKTIHDDHFSHSRINSFKASETKERKFLYTNADQFINKRDDLIMFISNDEPDVLMIAEVIPKKQESPITHARLDINGYEHVLNFDPGERDLGVSGKRDVAIYQASVVEFEIDGFTDHKWIEVSSKRFGTLLCGCIHRSPSGSDKKSRVESSKKVTEFIKMANERNSNLLITGDFNYKDIEWSAEHAPPEHDHLLNFIETLQNCYLTQHVNEPTRFREHEEPNILDLIISNEDGMMKDLNDHPPLGESDHLCLTFSVEYNQCNTPFSPSRNVYKADYNKIREELQQYKWSELFNGSFESDYDCF